MGAVAKGAVWLCFALAAWNGSEGEGSHGEVLSKIDSSAPSSYATSYYARKVF